MVKKKVSFWARKPIKVPKKVSFKTSSGKRVSFIAKKTKKELIEEINKLKEQNPQKEERAFAFYVCILFGWLLLILINLLLYYLKL